MNLDIFQVDAFTRQPLRGNPAAVVPLEEWLEDEQLLAIAMENNLSETAFFLPESEGNYPLRWFTPTREVDLCGHATLASAHVLLNEINPGLDRVRFQTMSGELDVERRGDVLAMTFPSRPAVPWDDDGALAEALGARPAEILKTTLQNPESDKVLAVFDSESDVAALKPHMSALMSIPGQGVVATAAGDEVDFVSRYFVPKVGVPEDPVTGSTHCTLSPYWASRLGRTRMTARQVSRRGGELEIHQQGDQVEIAGPAVLVMRGKLFL